MDGPALGIYGTIVLLLAILLFRIPAAVVMAIVGFVGMAMCTSASSAMGVIGMEFWNIFSGYGLTVIPMFILVGEIIYFAGYSDELYQVMDRWVGHWPGGLAITTILACAGFSAICGSNTATAATMCAVAMPSMKRMNYHPVLRTGVVAAGSTLGVMIPPSIVLVVYGLHTSQSIGKLFFGTVIPGVTLAVLMSVMVLVSCLRHPEYGPPGPRSSWSQRLRALIKVLDILVLFVAIMAALFTGVVTPTEAAAVSCFLALVMCLIRHKLTWEKFLFSIRDTLRISCMVFIIVAGAIVFGRFMTLTRLPSELATWISSLSLSPVCVLLIITVFYIIGGCIMDALAFLLISLPIFSPLVNNMGYDLVWFGEVLCLVTTLGAITPPVGISCYVVGGMSKDVPLEQVFKGAMYFVPAYVLTFVLMLLFPHHMVMILANLVR